MRGGGAAGEEACRGAARAGEQGSGQGRRGCARETCEEMQLEAEQCAAERGAPASENDRVKAAVVDKCTALETHAANLPRSGGAAVDGGGASGTLIRPLFKCSRWRSASRAEPRYGGAIGGGARGGGAGGVNRGA